MRRLIAACAALIVVALPAAEAQSDAVIRGRVVHGKTDRGLPNIVVTLLGARDDGSGRIKEESNSGRDGSFAFPKVEIDPQMTYTVEAEYDDGLFVGENIAIEDGEASPIDLELWDTTPDPAAISIARHHVFVLRNSDGVGVLESVTVTNETEEAYVGRAATMGGDTGPGTPTLGFGLPPQAIGGRVDILSSDINRLYVTETDFGFAATVAIPPGETTTIFGYAAEGTGGSYDISRRILYPTEELATFVTDPFVVQSNRLAPDKDETIRGRTYNVWRSTEPLDPGDLVPLAAVAEGSSSSGLETGAVIGLGALALLIAAAFMWRKRGSAPAPKTTREDLLTAIAELDLKKDVGDISAEEWAARRASLKSRLREPEPAP
ncbi:MAG: hypothetical protein M3285_03230 [Actinomycetota bacterium]|nr:hypothetical protein [Actinomycetota bacterium]